MPASPPDPLIRPARTADAPGCLEIYAPIVIETPISFELTVPSVSEFASRIATTLPDYPWLVAMIDNKISGYAYACRHRERTAYQWSTEVSAYVASDCHRSGIGRG